MGSTPATRIEATLGDLTRTAADVIVNAANSTLLGGGGVDGAIHQAAGPKLLEACRRLRRTTHRDGLPVGEAVATEGFDLPSRWVIHTVGPNRHRGQRDPAMLASCFTTSLTVAAALGARSVAFPAVGAGAYGWAPESAALIAVDAVRGWVRANPEQLTLVRFVLFNDTLMTAFTAALNKPTAQLSAAPASRELHDPN